MAAAAELILLEVAAEAGVGRTGGVEGVEGVGQATCLAAVEAQERGATGWEVAVGDEGDMASVAWVKVATAAERGVDKVDMRCHHPHHASRNRTSGTHS